MSSITILMGFPSEEKEFYLKKTKKIIVDLDQLRKGATGSFIVDLNDDPLVQHLAQRTTHFHLNQQQPVVINDLFLSLKSRATYIDLALKMKVPINLHWFDTPKSDFNDYCLKSPPTEAEEKGWLNTTYIEKLFSTFEFPSIEEGFHNFKYH